MTINIFYSYSDKDDYWQKKLEVHLSSLKRQGLIAGWHRRNVTAGRDWENETNINLNAAHLILLLISPDFIASDYSYTLEAKRAMERYEAGNVRIIPIILRPTDWRSTPFNKLQVLPLNGKPITIWRNRDEAFLEVTVGIRRVVEELNTNIRIKQAEPVEAHREHWGEAPGIEQFYGREKELILLKQWVLHDQCRLVALYGIGGIGKTTVATGLASQIKDRFTHIFWYSLLNAPSIESFLETCILFISNQEQPDLPKDVHKQFLLLIEYLQKYRCLFILDNFESVLQGGGNTGKYREGYEWYGNLLRIGEIHHQSCFILTSRERMEEITVVESNSSLVRSLHLSGLDQSAGQKLLRDKGLLQSEEAWKKLVSLYSGNPLALKLVSAPIAELFGGDVTEFLRSDETIIDNVYDLLHHQFLRLSQLEAEIMYWLAIEHEAVSLHTLQENITPSPSRRVLLGALNSLNQRSLIEISQPAYFTLQPMIMEYVTNEFTERICEELDKEVIELFGTHALLKAEARTYVKESQGRFVLIPIIEYLVSNYGEEKAEDKIKRMLIELRQAYHQRLKYAAGNVLNLLIHMQKDLSGYDFSHLTVQQAYLQEVSLRGVNFAHANLTKSVFADTFDNIFSLSWSADGALLAAGLANGEVRIWDASDSTPLLVRQADKDWVWAVALSPDKTILASAGDDKNIHLWEVGTGNHLRMLQGHSGGVWSIAFSPDGTTLISGSYDQTIRLWEIMSGECKGVFQGHNNWIAAVAYNPDGRMLASGGGEYTVRLWDVHTRQCLHELISHTRRINTVAFSPAGDILVSGSDDQTICLWEVSTGQCLYRLLGHTRRINAIAFSSDGAILVSGSDDQTIRLWEIRTGRCVHVLHGHVGAVWAVASCATGTFASGGQDQTIRLWEYSTGRCIHTLQGHSYWVVAVTFSPDGKFLASAGSRYVTRLWKVAEERDSHSLYMLQGHTGQIGHIAFSPDGANLATGGVDQTIRLWDRSSGRCLRVLRGHDGQINTVAFHIDGTIVASCSTDQTIRLWECSTGRNIRILQGHTDAVEQIAFSSDGKLLVSAGGDQTVRLWEVSSGQCLFVLDDHHSWINSVALSPDGTLLASGGEDETIHIWEISTRQCLRVLRGHSHRIWEVAFSPDKKFLASGSGDQTIRLWEVNSGKCLNVFEGHIGGVRSVNFSPDGLVLASGGYDGFIKLWNIQTGACLSTLRSDRLYEGMNITYTKGLTDAQKTSLLALGAIQDE